MLTFTKVATRLVVTAKGAGRSQDNRMMVPRARSERHRPSTMTAEGQPRRCQEKTATTNRRDTRSTSGNKTATKQMCLDTRRHSSRVRGMIQEAPRRPQEAPKIAPRGFQEAPRGLQEAAPKRPQDGPKRLPRGTQEAPQRLPGCSQEAPKIPRGLKKIPEAPKTLKNATGPAKRPPRRPKRSPKSV